MYSRCYHPKCVAALQCHVEPGSRLLKLFRFGWKVSRLASRLEPQNTAHVSKCEQCIGEDYYTPQSTVSRSTDFM